MTDRTESIRSRAKFHVARLMLGDFRSDENFNENIKMSAFLFSFHASDLFDGSQCNLAEWSAP